jgi:DNA topoisomerase IA
MEQDSEMIAEMIKCYEIIESREMLNAISVASFPHMKKADRAKLDRQLNKRQSNEAPRRLTMADLAKAMGAKT